jgi:hypothetical protein
MHLIYLCFIPFLVTGHLYAMAIHSCLNLCLMFIKLNSSIHVLFEYVPVYLLRWAILIDLVFIKFFILNIICGPITIIHLSSVARHIQIRYLRECSPFNNGTSLFLNLTLKLKFESCNCRKHFYLYL